MTNSVWKDDDGLLADLAAAVRDIAPMIPAVTQRGRAAYAWRTVDDELLLAGMSFDSEVDLAAATRDDASGPRVLVFDAAGISVELEISTDQVAGQILPPAAGTVTVELQDQPAGTMLVRADELGFFVLPPLPAGLARLRCDTGTATLVTEWVRL
jgi:hypothetical protein